MKAEKMHWFFAYAGKMMGAYAVAVTASCVNIIPRFMPENASIFVFLLTRTASGILPGIISARTIKKYKTKFKIEVKPSFSSKLKQLFAKKQLA